jgi:hypothetical protein
MKTRQSWMQGKSDRSIKLNSWVFVDDGFPEASEYDSNYVSYDAGTPGSFERAIKKNWSRSVPSTLVAALAVE